MGGIKTSNVAGVDSIDHETAKKLLDEFGDMDAVFTAAKSVTLRRANSVLNGAKATALLEQMEYAYLSRDLVRLWTRVNVPRLTRLDFTVALPNPDILRAAFAGPLYHGNITIPPTTDRFSRFMRQDRDSSEEDIETAAPEARGGTGLDGANSTVDGNTTAVDGSMQTKVNVHHLFSVYAVHDG
jgi:5'-3' exonuclease